MLGVEREGPLRLTSHSRSVSTCHVPSSAVFVCCFSSAPLGFV
jgi:hypothetical protein